MSTISALHTPMNRQTIADFARTIAGTCHVPGDPAYDECCAIWNAMIERRPALVVRPANSADVAAAIAFARDNALPLSVRGGGHNIAGAALSAGGVTIDMSHRRAVTVDIGQGVVHVEAGASWKDVDAVTQMHGLIVPSGIISATGVAGLTLGAGFGWTSRKFGFAADNLVSAQVVTADGRALTASASENPDLFWALRGGGGSFAVVTDFTFHAHRHGPQVLAGMVVHPFAEAAKVIDLFREVTSRAPDELTCLLVLRKAPPAPWIPPGYHGQPIAGIAAHWTGRPEDGVEAMRPLKAFGKPVADTIEPKTFIAFQTFLDGGQPFGRRYYWKSNEASEISPDLARVLEQRGSAVTSPFSAILVMHMGGMPTRIPAEDTAVGIRSARYAVVFQSAWTEAGEDERHIAWARDSNTAASAFCSGVPYVNFLTSEEAATRVRSAYHDRTYNRLQQVKTAYDPGNLLRGTLNIPPERAV